MFQLGFRKGDTAFDRWAMVELVGFLGLADVENLMSYWEV